CSGNRYRADISYYGHDGGPGAAGETTESHHRASAPATRGSELNEKVSSIAVGIVVEREKAKSEWADYVWRPIAALPGMPEAEPWTKLTEDEGRATFYAGNTVIELFETDTTYYRDNLASGEPLLWVALRRRDGEWPYQLFKVTADPAEGEALTETGTDLVETVPMPKAIKGLVADFVVQYHVERPFLKRKRDRPDPEVFGRRSVTEPKK